MKYKRLAAAVLAVAVGAGWVRRRGGSRCPRRPRHSCPKRCRHGGADGTK